MVNYNIAITKHQPTQYNHTTNFHIELRRLINIGLRRSQTKKRIFQIGQNPKRALTNNKSSFTFLDTPFHHKIIAFDDIV